MNKLGLIISREYITRVKNKKFLLTTLLTPLGVLLFILCIGFIFSYQSDKQYLVSIIDQSGMQIQAPDESRRFKFELSDQNLPELKKQYLNHKIDAVLVLPKFAGVDVKDYTAYFYSDKALDIEMEAILEKTILKRVRQEKMKLLSFQEETVSKLDTDIKIDPEPISDNVKDKSSNTGKIATLLGGLMGYIIFFIIFLYGASVMRSVTEEKVNRIVEIIISSCTSTELMLGKIIGIGLVGLTQLLIWIIIIPIVFMIGTALTGMDESQMQQVAQQGQMMNQTMDPDSILQIIQELKQINWLKIGILFLLYFLGGYFVYASMFAAIGAAVGDDINDSQSLTIFITIPIMLAIYISFSVIREPESTLAIFASIFPLFSPIVMPSLIVFDPPFWQILCSLIVLFAFAWLIIALSGRIYRTGILMYGKKASLKEISRWLFTKQ